MRCGDVLTYCCNDLFVESLCFGIEARRCFRFQTMTQIATGNKSSGPIDFGNRALDAVAKFK